MMTDQACEQLHAVLGESCICCELTLAWPAYYCHPSIASLSPVVAEELFRLELSDKGILLQTQIWQLTNANITIDKFIEPISYIQIHCADHEGLLYDIMRPLKYCNIQVVYGRFSPNAGGYCDLDLFMHQKDGKKIVDIVKCSTLCFQMKI